MYKKILYIVY